MRTKMSAHRYIFPGIIGFLIVASAANAARAASPTSSNNRGRARQSHIEADIRLSADSRVAQALVAINKDSEDGQWILASNADVPLLDRWRGENAVEAGPSDTTIRAIKRVAVAAGIDATDTVICILDRRLKREPELRRYRTMGVVEKDTTGQWRLASSPDGDESVDRLFAKMKIDDETADMRALSQEIRRQIATSPAR